MSTRPHFPCLRSLAITAFIAFTAVASAQAPAPAGGSLTLKQALDYGRANSPALVIAANDRKKADAQTWEALSGYLPQINGTGQLDDNLKRQTTILPAGIFSDQPVAVQFGTQYVTTLNLQAEQTLIDVAQLNGIQANKPNTEMAAIKEQQAEEQLVYDAAKAYGQALTYREQTRLLDANAKKYDDLVPILRLRLTKGVAQPLDVDRVEVIQRNIASQRTVAEANYELSVAQLKRIIGMPLATPLVLSDSVTTVSKLHGTGDAAFALDNLLPYRYGQRSLLLYGIDVQRKRHAFIPTLSAYGRYGAAAQGNDLSESYNNWFDYSTIGLKLNVPLFSGLRRVSQIKQSEIALSSAQEQLKASSLGWELEYRNADTRLAASRSNMQNDEQNLALAQRVFDTTNLQYQQGIATLSDLLNADYQLKEARNNYTTSLLNNYMAFIDIEKAKGTLLQFAKTL